MRALVLYAGIDRMTNIVTTIDLSDENIKDIVDYIDLIDSLAQKADDSGIDSESLIGRTAYSIGSIMILFASLCRSRY